METQTSPEVKTMPEPTAKRRFNAASDISERARMLKPLSQEAHKIYMIAKETNDFRLLSLSAEVQCLIMEAL